jgi:hypothetical protein
VFKQDGDVLNYDIIGDENLFPKYSSFWKAVLGYRKGVIEAFLELFSGANPFYRNFIFRLNADLVSDSDMTLRITRTIDPQSGFKTPFFSVLISLVYGSLSFMIISDLIDEKASRIKEGLFLIGVKPVSYYAGTSLAYLFFFLLQMIVIGSIYANVLPPERVPFSTEFMMFAMIVLGIYNIMLSILISQVFKTRKGGQGVFSLLFITLPILSNMIFSGVPDSPHLHRFFSLTPCVLELLISFARGYPITLSNMFNETLQNVPSPGAMIFYNILGIFLLSIFIFFNEFSAIYGSPVASFIRFIRQEKETFDKTNSDSVTAVEKVSAEKSSSCNVKLENVWQKYPGAIFPSLKNMNLEVYSGEIFGLLI